MMDVVRRPPPPNLQPSPAHDRVAWRDMDDLRGEQEGSMLKLKEGAGWETETGPADWVDFSGHGSNLRCPLTEKRAQRTSELEDLSRSAEEGLSSAMHALEEQVRVPAGGLRGHDGGVRPAARPGPSGSERVPPARLADGRVVVGAAAGFGRVLRADEGPPR